MTEKKGEKTKALVRSPSRWALAAIACALLGAAVIVVGANLLVWLLPRVYENAMNLTLAAALVAVAGVLLSAHWKLGEKQEELSRFYLEKSLLGWDKAWTILNDALTGDSDDRRVKWIAAARILERSRILTTRVSEASHRDVLEIELTHQRQRFHAFFEQPGWFYYGVSAAAITVPPESSLMDEAAKASTAGDANRLALVRSIPEQAIFTVWRALQFPSDYWDVIDSKASFEEGKVVFLDPGLREYINHTRQWRSVVGQLVPRRQ